MKDSSLFGRHLSLLFLDSFLEHCYTDLAVSKTSLNKRKGKKIVSKTQNAKTVVKTTERNFKRPVLVTLVVIILLAYIAIQTINIDRPFFAANDDDNTSYGLGAYNLARFVKKILPGLKRTLFFSQISPSFSTPKTT